MEDEKWQEEEYDDQKSKDYSKLFREMDGAMKQAKSTTSLNVEE